MELHSEQIQKLLEERKKNEKEVEQLERRNVRLKNREEYLAKRERSQHIYIKCDGVGFIPLDELMKAETARPKSRRPLKTQGFHQY